MALTDNLYRIQIGGPNDDPAFREFLLNDPDGYVFIPPEVVSLFLVDSPPEVADYFSASQSGFLPVASFTVAFELPFYDPSRSGSAPEPHSAGADLHPLHDRLRRCHRLENPDRGLLTGRANTASL